MHAKPPWIDIPRQAISNGRWHATWFLTVEEICPLEYVIGQVGPIGINIIKKASTSRPHCNEY
jgi:hypothetical protein